MTRTPSAAQARGRLDSDGPVAGRVADVASGAVVVVDTGGSCRSVVAGSVVAFTATPGVGGGTCSPAGASQSTAIDVPAPMSAAVTSSVKVIGGGGETN